MLTTDRQLPCSLSLHYNFCCCTGIVTVVKVVQKLSLPGVLLNNNHAFMDLLQLLVHRLFLGKVLQADMAIIAVCLHYPSRHTYVLTSQTYLQCQLKSAIPVALIHLCTPFLLCDDSLGKACRPTAAF